VAAETILYQERKSHIDAAEVDGDELWVTLPELHAASGWELKPEGVCLEEICVPVPDSRLPALIRKLRSNIGHATGPGPAKRDVDAIVRGYLDAVRVDLAQGIAGAPPISVPLTDLKGDLAAFLDLVPPPGK